MKTFLVIGVGRFGRHLCQKLSGLGYEVMAIDTDEEEIEHVLPYTVNSMIGDGTNKEFIRSLGPETFDICFVTIGDCFQTSLLVTYTLKACGAKQVVARASDEVQEMFLLRNGADAVVYPEREMANWTAIRYSVNNVLNYIELPGANSIFEVGVPAYWAGMTIGELDLAGKYHVNIMATKKDDQLDMKIGPDTKLEGGESILVYGKDRDLQRGLNLGNKRFHSD